MRCSTGQYFRTTFFGFNDLSTSVNCNLLLNADDSAVFTSHKDPKIISDILSRELESCKQWLIDNKLSLHFGKTESILFGLLSMRIISRVEVLQNPVFKKPVVDFLYSQRYFLNQRSHQTLCTALIQCHFDYCCSSWFSTLSAKWKHKLQVMQNKIIRFILRLEPRSHIGSDEFEKLGMLKVEDRIKQLKLNHVFKIYHDEAPEYLISHFRKFSNIHRYSTRSSATNFILPTVKGQAWNSVSLPNHVKTSKTHVQFKKAVKSHFLSKF